MDTPLDKLTEQFRRLPGIGVKTARKLAYYIVQQPNSRVDEFVDAIRDAKQNMHFCSVCFNLSSQDPCPICSDISRDRSTICVVETPQDVQAIERSGDYHGLYHVLHGALSPLDGVNVEDLRIRELLQRLGNTTVKEVILATDPDVEGEATALYLARLIKTAGIRVTRIARGLPMPLGLSERSVPLAEKIQDILIHDFLSYLALNHNIYPETWDENEKKNFFHKLQKTD